MLRPSICLLAIVFILSSLACTTTTTTIVHDTGRQAVLYESARAPHMKGPGLRGGEVSTALGYNVALGPRASGNRLPGQGTGGGAIAMHTVEGRIAVAMNTPEDPHRRAWEFGANLGFTHAGLAQAQADDFHLSAPSDVYARIGFGFRGPVLDRRKVVLGLNFEVDFSALPYRTEIIRSTQQFSTVTGVDLVPSIVESLLFMRPSPPKSFRYEGQEYSVQSEVKTGHAFFPTFRAGMYSAFHFHERFMLSGGISIQNTPAVNGIETQIYECEHTGISWHPHELPSSSEHREIAEKCREKQGKEFPVIHHAFATTFYAGMHIILDDITLTLRAQTNLIFSRHSAFASPISGDLEIAYRF
ncbi:MAG: hypothetical protein VX223_12810 [Myxococcota bacterium]|nr:hypothetical protein [Myxococcota bacterium]